MKKFKITVAALLALGLSPAIFAQQVQQGQQTQQSSVPQAIKYQAIARTANGEAITNQSVSFRISILKGSADGTPVYQETQTVTTNQFGLANISIGLGTVTAGQFNSIEWGNSMYFAKIEFDPKGGNEYVFMGTSQLLSVPYSLYSEHAKTADNIPTFPIKAALQATNLQAPFDSPETGMLVYNSSTSGTSPYNVIPGYYYNAGTPEEPKWISLSSTPSDDGHSTKRAMSLGTNTSYGGAIQDNAVASAVGTCGSGSDNSAFGDSAMNSAMSGSDNTGEGYYVLHKLSGGNYNTAMGSQAMYSNTYGTYNTAVGYEALYKQNFGSSTWNSFNTAIGGFALYNNISTSTTNGYENTAVGYEAGYNNSIGYRNTSVGLQAGLENTSGNANTNVGYGTSYQNSTGGGNTIVGYAANFGSSGNSNSWNSALGDSALYGNTTGDSNTAVGYKALNSNTTGNSNTAIGYGANVNASGLSNATAIGKGAIANGSNTMQLGNANVTALYFGTTNNLPTTATAANVYYNNATGEFFRSTSSRRYKKNITDIKINTSLIYKLRPVSYASISDNSLHFGLIAEEVAQIIPELAEYAKEKDVIKGSSSEELIPDAVQYSLLSVLLLNEVQKHETTITEQQQAIDSLKAINYTQTIQINNQNKAVEDQNLRMANDEQQIAELKKLVTALTQAQASVK